MKKVFLDLVPISSSKPLWQQRLEVRKRDQIQKWSSNTEQGSPLNCACLWFYFLNSKKWCVCLDVAVFLPFVLADKEACHVFALHTCNLVSTVSTAVRKRTWIYKTQFIPLHLNITLIKDMAAVWANGLLVTLKVWCFIFFFLLSLLTLYIPLPYSKGFAKCNGGCVWAEWFLSINSSYTLSSVALNTAEMSPSLIFILIHLMCSASLMFTRWCHLIIE